MENKVEIPPSGILFLEALMQNITVARLKSTRLQNPPPLPPPPYFKCNVLRESLSVYIQNIPCATLKRKGSWVVISVYLWFRMSSIFSDSSLWRTVRMDFASVKNAAEALGNFLSHLSALERIVVTNETYESYSEPVKPLINRM
jgi:hypothetical protein